LKDGHHGDCGFLHSGGFRSLCSRARSAHGGGLGPLANVFELLFLGFAGALVYALVLIVGLRIANVKLARSRV
jgi:hypothetical protein